MTIFPAFLTRSGRSAAATAKVPPAAAQGYRYLLMAMDDGDVVAETDEHDNVAVRPLRVANWFPWGPLAAFSH